MTKGLEALQVLYETMPFVFEESKTKMRCLEIIEKELKALEIIRKKQVNVSALLELDNLQQYNAYCNLAGGCKKLTLKEYDLLKEVLICH